MKYKRLTALVIIAAVISCVFTSVLMAYADDIHWSYDSVNKTLVISGSGDMTDYQNRDTAPWSAHLQEVENVIIEEGVTSVGDYAFCGAAELESVVIASSVTKLGSFSFASCPLLMSLELSESVITISDASFAFDGTQEKTGFTLVTAPGTYALYYAYKNNISFICEDVRAGVLHVSLQKGMTAYFPYTPKISATYRFYSVSKHDTLGYIYDSDKNQIAYNDDHSGVYDSSQGSTDFGLNKALTAGNRYYLAVNIFNPSLTG
jgi:hypothetical protein